TLSLTVIIFVAGVLSGAMGAVLGLGGGIFLVPFLNLGLKFPLTAAAAISLTTVIATSSPVSAGRAGQQLSNMRLGLLVEVGTAAGSGRGDERVHDRRHRDRRSGHLLRPRSAGSRPCRRRRPRRPDRIVGRDALRPARAGQVVEADDGGGADHRLGVDVRPIVIMKLQ